ncbi:hypothetical protein Dda_5021 [Drechslerella dactyloides]|uniref:Uncharacterized protein n=1 Tax=Drechslerella dactyloides TaxID=74499 RepID=A0AAD6J2A0_DREDA|nr:hypothetical protein Dda_5021 [Drechslerella dactyloides]
MGQLGLGTVASTVAIPTAKGCLKPRGRPASATTILGQAERSWGRNHQANWSDLAAPSPHRAIVH